MKIKTVLVIEDDPEQNVLLKTRLEKCGYKVVAALNGEEGLDDALLILPDAVILDIMMPDLDGYGVCNILKQNSKTQHIPIIVLTSLGTAEAKEICKASGANAFIIKPYNSKELIEKIEELT